MVMIYIHKMRLQAFIEHPLQEVILTFYLNGQELYAGDIGSYAILYAPRKW